MALKTEDGVTGPGYPNVGPASNASNKTFGPLSAEYQRDMAITNFFNKLSELIEKFTHPLVKSND